MPEVYTLRAPENFNYNNVQHRSVAPPPSTTTTTRTVKNLTRPVSSQQRNMDHLRPSDYNRIPSTDRLKTTSNQRPTTATIKPKPTSAQAYRSLNQIKPEMYHIESNSTPKQQQQQRALTASTNTRKKLSTPYQPLNNRKTEMYHMRSNNTTKPTLQASRPQSRTKSPSKYQPLHNQKVEMYHIDSNNKNRQQPSRKEMPERPRSIDIPSRSNTPATQKVTTYTIAPADDDRLLPYVPRTPSPPVSQ